MLSGAKPTTSEMPLILCIMPCACFVKINQVNKILPHILYIYPQSKSLGMINPALNRCFPLFWCVILVQLFCIAHLNAQTVIGGDTVDQSAILDIQDTAKGVLLPRMTSIQRNAIVNPANGLLIFNTSENGIQVNEGTPQSPVWVKLSPIPSTGNQTGNMLFWNGTDWVRLAPGLPGQALILSQEGIPIWTGAALATITTNAPTAITPTSAAVGGQIIAGGGANVSNRGIVWGITANPTLSSNVLALGNGTGSFSSTLSGLSPNTIYYIRAYATNGAGTAYGTQKSFSTLPISIPALTTNGISSLTQTNAITGGNITNDGGATVTQRGVVYATTQNPTLSNAFTQDGGGTGNFTSTLSGLTPNTTYYVRAYATNSAGTAYGNQHTFVTQIPAVPSLSTREVINVTNATATSGGTISNDGGSAITAKGVVWATTANPTLSDTKTSDGISTATYSSFLTGLAPGTTYYIRAYATNSVGTGYGNQLSFTTALVSNTTAMVQTLSVTGIALQQVTVNAEVTSQGGGTVTDRGIVWNSTGNPTVNSNRIKNGTEIGAYSTNITGLTGGTQYYVRAYAVNAFGISYGQEIALTTAVGVPIVSTNTNWIATTTTLQGGGNVIEAGGSPVTARGVVFATTSTPTITNGNIATGNGLGSFTLTIPGLNSNTTYYIRAYATNNSGTGYGNEVTFTTDAMETPGPQMTDIDGNTYPSVQIGNQVWTSSNLRTARYRNGDLIPYIVGDSEWQSGNSGKWSFYNHEDLNNFNYGKLYNGYAVTDSRGLCPTGWHVPDIYELEVLATTLGGDSIVGGKLKSVDLWNSPNTGATNSSGFNAVPGGSRASSGSFSGQGIQGQYWTSSGATVYRFSNNSAGLTKSSTGSLGQGNAVRCIQNSAPKLNTTPIGIIYTNSTAATGGERISDGGEGIISKGVVWSTAPGPTTADSLTESGTGANNFFSMIRNLVDGTTYFYRAFAINSIGTAYGNELSFTFYSSQAHLKNIPSGTFLIGCTQGDSNCGGNEFPVHSVSLNAFQIGETEVTQAQWISIMGSNPSSFKNPNCSTCPVETVSWYDAVVFCNRLSEAQGLSPCYYYDAAFTRVYGKNDGVWSLPNNDLVYWNTEKNGYRLPTESEWEYASRGGNYSNSYSGSTVIEEVAWYISNSGSRTKSVKGKAENGYGLFDMSGNVYEWCWDTYSNYTSEAKINPTGPPPGSDRLLRGGSWYDNSHICRVSRRDAFPLRARDSRVGFRLARTP